MLAPWDPPPLEISAKIIVYVYANVMLILTLVLNTSHSQPLFMYNLEHVNTITYFSDLEIRWYLILRRKVFLFPCWKNPVLIPDVFGTSL